MDTVTLIKGGGLTLEDCEDNWTAVTAIAANTTTLDTADYQRGVASVRIGVHVDMTAPGNLAYEDTTPINQNLSSYNSAALWIKSSIALNSADMALAFDNDLALASIDKVLGIPALVANQWTRVEWPGEDFSAITSLSSVGIRQLVDKGAFNLWIDDLIVGDSKSFEILDIIGMPELEVSQSWPNGLTTELLDGTISVKRSRSRRVVTIVFMNMEDYGDLTWIHDAIMYYPSLRIVYDSDEVEGANEQANFAMPRMSGVEFLKGGGPLTWRERKPEWSATRRPPSATVPS